MEEELPHQKIFEHEKEGIKFTISRFLEDKLIQAFQLKKEALERGEVIDIVQYLKNIWPENDGVVWQRKPSFVIPGLQEGITIRFDSHSDYDDVSKILTLNIANLRNAETAEELEDALINVLEDVYHEAEHIYSPGSDIEPQDFQQTIEYLGNAGEIEAHARQFAYRYLREFPGDSFDTEKMISVVSKTKDKGQGNKGYNYFVVFADPKKQEKYKEFGNIKEIHEKLVEATTRHFNNLSEQVKYK